jgi:tetratricopeptide (TPR) repeat protein
LLHKERAAYDTSRLLKDVTNKTPYMRVIIAVANIDSTSRKSQINALCRERLLDAYLSTIVLPKLIETNDCELAQTVVNSFTWKENQARVDFLTWVASVAYGRGELDRAVTLLGIALKKDPNYNIARRLRGLILAKQGFVAESNSDLQECIRRWPHDAAAHRQLGIRIVESANADIAQGLRHLRIALKLTPRDHSVHFFVGRRLLVAAKKTGRAGTNMSLLDEAAFAFEKACILTHHNRIDYVNGLCLTYVELGKHMQAAELIDTLYNKFDSGDPRLSELDEIRDYIATKKIEDLIKKNVESIDDSPR